MKNSGAIDMTQGNALQLILKFSVPMFIGNALQQLYNLVDSVIVGQFIGPDALAAVGVGFPVIFILSSLFIGLGMGATVMISQYKGSKANDMMQKTVQNINSLLTVSFLPLSIISILLINPLMDILSVPQSARADAKIYLIIVLGGLIGSLGFNMNSGLLQGIGDSVTPLICLAVASVLNIILDLILVIPLGVAGVALATVFSQIASWLFGIVYINKKIIYFKTKIFTIKFDKPVFTRLLKLGIPAGIQQALFGVAQLIMTRLVNSYGSEFSAGWNAANKVDTCIYMPIQSVCAGLTTYVGQNIGKGRPDRVQKGINATLGICLAFSAVGLLLIPFGPYVMRLFSPDAAVIQSGVAFLNRIMPFYWVLAISLTYNSAIRGAGNSIVPMLSEIIGLWVARTPISYLFAYWFGRDNLNYCYAAGWALGLLVTIYFYYKQDFKNKWKVSDLQKQS